jgi:hypothetical protein
MNNIQLIGNKTEFDSQLLLQSSKITFHCNPLRSFVNEPCRHKGTKSSALHAHLATVYKERAVRRTKAYYIRKPFSV